MRFRVFVLFSVLAMLSGCSSFMHGYTGGQARNQYLAVDENKQSFGAKRLGYIMSYRGAAFKAFVQEKGVPDYIFEFVEDGRSGVMLFYVDTDNAFLFQEKSWRPDSMVLVGYRTINEFERVRFGLPEKKLLTI